MDSTARTAVLVAESTPYSGSSTTPTGAAPNEARQPSGDPDEALRLAVKAAVDVGDVGRAMALLEVLRSSPKPAPVVDLASRRAKG